MLSARAVSSADTTRLEAAVDLQQARVAELRGETFVLRVLLVWLMAGLSDTGAAERLGTTPAGLSDVMNAALARARESLDRTRVQPAQPEPLGTLKPLEQPGTAEGAC